MVKIERLNPQIEQGLSAEKTGTIRPDKSINQAIADSLQQRGKADSLTLSIPDHQSEKDISVLLSNLLNALELPDELAGAGSKPVTETVAAVNDLVKVLDSLFYKGEEPLSFLKNFIEKSGLLYEAKIAGGDIKGLDGDLKGILLRLIEMSGKNSEGGKAAEAVLKDIEARQFFNAAVKDEGVSSLQIPFLFPNGPTAFADVYIRKDGNKKDGYNDASYRLGFSIELREAGLLSVDALVNRSSVSIRLKAEKAAFLEFMKSHIPELSSRLSSYGIRVCFNEGV